MRSPPSPSSRLERTAGTRIQSAPADESRPRTRASEDPSRGGTGRPRRAAPAPPSAARKPITNSARRAGAPVPLRQPAAAHADGGERQRPDDHRQRHHPEEVAPGAQTAGGHRATLLAMRSAKSRRARRGRGRWRCSPGAAQADRAHPDLSQLPLVPGARFQVQERVCDSGSNAYCAWELVVADRALPGLERAVRGRASRSCSAATGAAPTATSPRQHAADSPGHRLRVTYANPVDELTGIAIFGVRRSQAGGAGAVQGRVHRTPPVISMLLEVGAY